MSLFLCSVVSGSRDATLRLWDIETGQCLHVLMGHVAAVRCVQYDGHKVVSGAYDYTVKVWDPETESCIHTLQGHTNRVYSLQVRACGRLLFGPPHPTPSLRSSNAEFSPPVLSAVRWDTHCQWLSGHVDPGVGCREWQLPSHADGAPVPDQRHGAAGQHPGLW